MMDQNSIEPSYEMIRDIIKGFGFVYEVSRVCQGGNQLEKILSFCIRATKFWFLNYFSTGLFVIDFKEFLSWFLNFEGRTQK